MNIFFLHTNPEKAAINLNYPKLQNKMILESVQVLCTTLNLQNIETPYKSTHINHPSRLWLEVDMSNILWLIDHCQTLLNIYSDRTNKTHKCAAVLDHCINNLNKLNIKFDKLTNPHLAMKVAPDLLEKYGAIQDTIIVANSFDDAVLAYREYMTRKDYWLPEYQYID